MKLWILRPLDGLLDGQRGTDNPWAPWYDKSFGFVVRAENDALARGIANLNAGLENEDDDSPWLTARYSTCVELVPEGDRGLVMQDFKAA